MRDLVTDLFELLGLLALAVAAGMAGWMFVSPPVGVAAAGLLLIGASWLLLRGGRS